MVWLYVAICHFQQYFSYIVGVSFIGDRKPEFPGENHRPAAASHWETLSHNVVSSTPRQTLKYMYM